MPLQLNVQEGELTVQTAPWKRIISRAFFGTFILHGIHINFKLLWLLFSSEEIVRHHLVFHVDLALGSIMAGGWYIMCFGMYQETFVALFNEIFASRKSIGTLNRAYTSILASAK